MTRHMPLQTSLLIVIRDILIWRFLFSSADSSIDRAYRGFYLINWVYRFLTENHYRQWISEWNIFSVWCIQLVYPLKSRFAGNLRGYHFIWNSDVSAWKNNLVCALVLHFIWAYISWFAAWIAGIVQTALYADFFYYYLKRYNCIPRPSHP